MNNKSFLSNIRTDLAVEARDVYIKAKKIEEIDGIEVKIDEDENVKCTEVIISNNNGATALNKPIGRYINIDIKEDIRYSFDDVKEKIKQRLANEIFKLIEEFESVNKQKKIFVLGLGNINVTPDSIGSKVANNIEATRQAIIYTPQFIEGPTRNVTCLAPGVLGTTGMETSEIAQGIVNKVTPDIVIAIDALASKSTDRLGKTIQLANTGINPGSGLGNKREAIDKNTLGIPVISIGIPTVIDIATIMSDMIDEDELESKKDFENINKIIKNGNFVVTPTEIDDIISENAKLITSSLNMALQM